MASGPHTKDAYESSSDLVADPKSGRARWTRKRKAWTFFGILAAIIIIVVAVVVPIKLTRKNKPSLTYEELYFPQGFNGTGLNGALGGRRSNTSYDQLVVFGSSYSDNAHPRSSQYSGTIAGSGYWEGRWSNGPVWTEYLRDCMGNSTKARTGGNVTHLNYAYGGATTNNSIIPANSPDTGTQMQTYLTDPSYDPSGKKPLVAMFTSTNPIIGTFVRFWDPEDLIYQNRSAAMDVISQAALSLTRQLSGLIPSDTSLIAPDFLILPILPVEITPRARELAEQYNTTIDMVRDITIRYNEVMLEGAKDISASLGRDSRGNVFTYDVVAWVYSMQAHPENYGLISATEGCSLIGCSNPKQYIFWDILHLQTSMQERLALTAFNIVRDGT